MKTHHCENAHYLWKCETLPADKESAGAVFGRVKIDDMPKGKQKQLELRDENCTKMTV